MREIHHFCAKARTPNGLGVGLHFWNRKKRAACHLLGLPVELLLQILEILQDAPATPSNINNGKYQYPLLSLRLCV